VFVCAQPFQRDIVLSILDEAAGWLQLRGFHQWPVPFPEQRVVRQFERGEVYLALLNDQAVGTFALQASDVAVWGAQPADAFYVHCLAIRRSVGGRGVGQALLREAERLSSKAGKAYLRLDCIENAPLMRYYESAGFRYCGRVDGAAWSAALYEKQVEATNHG